MLREVRGVFLTTDFTDFTDFLLRIGGGERIGYADALSGRSGTSVVLLKYTLILVVLTMILFNHCFTDFTDICYARFGEFF